MTDYRLEVVKISESEYNVKGYYTDSKGIGADTFAQVINTIYRFKPGGDVFANAPILIGLTVDEEQAIQETRKRILRLNELEEKRKMILRVSSELEKLVQTS